MGERKEGRLAVVPTEERLSVAWPKWAPGERGIKRNFLLALGSGEGSESSSSLSLPECPPG